MPIKDKQGPERTTRLHDCFKITDSINPTSWKIDDALAGDVPDKDLPLIQTPFQPDDCCWTDERRIFDSAYQSAGGPGLFHALYELARLKVAQGDSQFHYFTDDESSVKPVLPFLVRSIHPLIVESLVRGNLAYRYQHEPRFRSMTDRNTLLKTTVGIYYNEFHHITSNIEADTQASSSPVQGLKENFAKGFSIRRRNNILEKMELYIDVHDPQSKEYAQKIHNEFRSSGDDIIDPDKTPNARRYMKNVHQNKVIKEYIEATRTKLLKRANKLIGTPDEALLDEPTRYGIPSVGYGGEVAHRVKAHKDNASTGNLLGLFNAIQRHEYPGQYQMSSYQILYICDPKHLNLSEALVSVLASSYHDEGGLNPKRAGAIGNEAGGWKPQGYLDNIQYILGPNAQPTGIKRSRQDAANKLNVLEEYINAEEDEGYQKLDQRVLATRKNVLRSFDELEKKAEAYDNAIATGTIKNLVADLKDRSQAFVRTRPAVVGQADEPTSGGQDETDV